MQTNPNHQFGRGFDDSYVCPLCGIAGHHWTQIGQGFDGFKEIKIECKNCGAKTLIGNKPPFRGYELSEDELTSIFDQAGIKILNKYQIRNEYWSSPKIENSECERYPWWLVKTRVGLIKIGWRKRVLHIDWSATSIRKIVTTDDVTKDECMVHAWKTEDAVKYLNELVTAQDAYNMLMKNARRACTPGMKFKA